MKIVRIDDGVRAKLVCDDCGGETYVPILGSVGKIIVELSDARANHQRNCR